MWQDTRINALAKLNVERMLIFSDRMICDFVSLGDRVLLMRIKSTVDKEQHSYTTLHYTIHKYNCR
jgi:hypothetical protein